MEAAAPAVPSAPAVLVTGASGLLGRAVAAAFREEGWTVTGTAHSRAGPGLVAVDLADPAALGSLVRELKPAVIVHAAAVRQPDTCESDPKGTERINIDATYAAARAASDVGAVFVHVSTDYLWDGSKAPYREDAPTCPLNAYGRQKARAEHAALAGCEGSLIVRVPVLYGPGAPAESAVLCFADTVRSGKPATLDDWQIRVPTLTTDIAATIRNLAAARLGVPARGHKAAAPAAGVSPSSLAGVFHYSAPERFTRWSLAQLFSRILDAPAAHITRLEGPPPGAPRPFDCQLDDAKLRATGLAAPCERFEDASRAILGLPPALAAAAPAAAAGGSASS